MTSPAELIEAAGALRPLLRSAGAEVERTRRLPTQVTDALHGLDAFHLQLTESYGGHAADPVTHLRVLEELSRGDGSSGWCAMVGSESSAAMNAFLAPDVIEAMTSTTPRQALALSAVGVGRADVVDGGLRVTGRWRFTSGCRHSQWLGGLCALHDANGPRLRPNGAPALRIVFAPAAAATVFDVWQVSGLAGTASDDFALENVLIPDSHVVDLFGTPRDASPVWRLPAGLRFALSKAAAVCGMARAALDAAGPLLERTPMVGGRPAREEPRVQIGFAEAEGALEAGRAYLYQNVQQAWDLVRAGGTLDLAGIARTRLAVVQAARLALAAAAKAQEIAGSASIFDPTLDRAVRDLNVARHHLQLQAHVVEDVGRVMLGQAPRNPLF